MIYDSNPIIWHFFPYIRACKNAPVWNKQMYIQKNINKSINILVLYYIHTQHKFIN